MESIYSKPHRRVNGKTTHRRIVQVKLPAIKWVFKSSLSQSAKLIFGALYAFSNTNNKCWPSITTLADTVSAGRQRVRAALKELSDAGLIHITTTSGGSYSFELKPNVTINHVEEVVQWDEGSHQATSLPDAQPTTNGPNRATSGMNVSTKVQSKGGNEDKSRVKELSPPVSSSISDVYAATSLKARPLLLKDLTLNAIEYKKRYCQDGWLDEEHRKNFVLLRDEVRKLEKLTFGVRISTL